MRHPWALLSGYEPGLSLPAQQEFCLDEAPLLMAAQLPGAWALSVCVCIHIWISDYCLKDPGAACWLPNGRAGGCSSCNNLFVLWDGTTADHKAAEGLCGLLTLLGTVA